MDDKKQKLAALVKRDPGTRSRIRELMLSALGSLVRVEVLSHVEIVVQRTRGVYVEVLQVGTRCDGGDIATHATRPPTASALSLGQELDESDVAAAVDAALAEVREHILQKWRGGR